MAQTEAVNRLADNVYHGARVKTRPDGIAEARTIEQGEYRHYHISTDGRVTLVAAEPTRSYLIGCVLLCGGVILFLAMFLLLAVLQESEVGWAAGFGGLGFVLGFVGQFLLSPPSSPGEFWVNIGAPQD